MEKIVSRGISKCRPIGHIRSEQSSRNSTCLEGDGFDVVVLEIEVGGLDALDLALSFLSDGDHHGFLW